MPFRPNNSNMLLITHFYFKFKHFFYIFCINTEFMLRKEN